MPPEHPWLLGIILRLFGTGELVQHRVGAQQSGAAQAALLCPCAANIHFFNPSFPVLKHSSWESPAEGPVWNIIFRSRDL